jgi:hypothetical protein
MHEQYLSPFFSLPPAEPSELSSIAQITRFSGRLVNLVANGSGNLSKFKQE